MWQIYLLCHSTVYFYFDILCSENMLGCFCMVVGVFFSPQKYFTLTRNWSITTWTNEYEKNNTRINIIFCLHDFIIYLCKKKEKKFMARNPSNPRNRVIHSWEVIHLKSQVLLQPYHWCLFLTQAEVTLPLVLWQHLWLCKLCQMPWKWKTEELK